GPGRRAPFPVNAIRRRTADTTPRAVNGYGCSAPRSFVGCRRGFVPGTERAFFRQQPGAGGCRGGPPSLTTRRGSRTDRGARRRKDGAALHRSRAVMSTPTIIRPDLRSLRKMPTIHQVAEAWGRLELKLETNDTRYWVTTEGVPQKTSGTPINYVVDY